jgi:hypothetical protein
MSLYVHDSYILTINFTKTSSKSIPSKEISLMRDILSVTEAAPCRKEAPKADEVNVTLEREEH